MKAQTLSPEVLKTSSMPSASWGLFFQPETLIALRTAFHESPLKMKRFAFAIWAATACAHPPSPSESRAPLTPPTNKLIYSGFYIESSRESIFYPCGSAAGSSGWWLRFLPGVKAERARYQYDGPEMTASNHFIVVGGTDVTEPALL